MTVRYYVLNERREVVPARDLYEWARMFGGIDARRVALTDLELCEVSTVFLGLDHRFGKGPPIVFETLVMLSPEVGEGEGLGGETMRRYCTWAEAEVGHMEVVEEVRERVEQFRANAESITAAAFIAAIHGREEPR